MAKPGIKSGKTYTILGVTISGTPKEQLLNEIRTKIANRAYTKPYFIITAYSENVLECGNDPDLNLAFKSANRVVADGTSILAAREYLNIRTGRVWKDIGIGLKVGGKVLRGEFSDQKIVGVRLAEKMMELSLVENIKVYLLGGKGGACEILRKKYGRKIEYYEPEMNLDLDNQKINNDLLVKINKVKPDVLLVGLGRFRQEKWIYRNLDKIRAKVVIGVGSSFDELAKVGEWADPTPDWVEKLSLKWLWRAFKNPNHIKRAWNAFVIFSWKVYRGN